MTNRPGGVLYIGVTAHLSTRVHQHRHGKGGAFTSRYKLEGLVYAERHETIYDAIAREKAMKAWQRAWKVRLIESINPEWRDLWGDLASA